MVPPWCDNSKWEQTYRDLYFHKCPCTCQCNCVKEGRLTPLNLQNNTWSNWVGHVFLHNIFPKTVACTIMEYFAFGKCASFRHLYDFTSMQIADGFLFPSGALYVLQVNHFYWVVFRKPFQVFLLEDTKKSVPCSRTFMTFRLLTRPQMKIPSEIGWARLWISHLFPSRKARLQNFLKKLFLYRTPFTANSKTLVQRY